MCFKMFKKQSIKSAPKSPSTNYDPTTADAARKSAQAAVNPTHYLIGFVALHLAAVASAQALDTISGTQTAPAAKAWALFDLSLAMVTTAGYAAYGIVNHAAESLRLTSPRATR